MSEEKIGPVISPEVGEDDWVDVIDSPEHPNRDDVCNYDLVDGVVEDHFSDEAKIEQEVSPEDGEGSETESVFVPGLPPMTMSVVYNTSPAKELHSLESEVASDPIPTDLYEALQNQVNSLTTALHTLSSYVLSNAVFRTAVKPPPSASVRRSNGTPVSNEVNCPFPVDGLPEEINEDVQETWSMLHKLSNSLSSAAPEYPKISFMNFKVGDIVLFMPAFVDNRKIWMAFNSGLPHYFLSDDSLQVFLSKSKNRENRSSIIGKIIYLEKQRASCGNAYQLPVGLEYHVCHAEPLYRQDLQLQKQHISSKVSSPSSETKLQKNA